MKPLHVLVNFPVTSHWFLPEWNQIIDIDGRLSVYKQHIVSIENQSLCESVPSMLSLWSSD